MFENIIPGIGRLIYVLNVFDLSNYLVIAKVFCGAADEWYHGLAIRKNNALKGLQSVELKNV